ncbi:hypothetical protein [Streptococcus himalayensis]|uniref:hypothetical protein n=1 Tax=Streptococcus himalayensis TaxID=1888195 RepID=UPI00083D2812|nr:hypothetical protein [Streptococcus himalayensis]
MDKRKDWLAIVALLLALTYFLFLLMQGPLLQGLVVHISFQYFLYQLLRYWLKKRNCKTYWKWFYRIFPLYIFGTLGLHLFFYQDADKLGALLLWYLAFPFVMFYDWTKENEK